MANQHDFSITDGGSIYIITPQTDAGREWWEDHVPDAQSWGMGYAVEHRYIQDISTGILNDGLSITKDGKTMQFGTLPDNEGELVLV